MSDYLGGDPADLIVQMQGILGGLITQEEQDPTHSLQQSWAGPGGCEAVVPQTHCFRSVSQRSLSTPVTFLSQNVAVVAGADLLVPITTAGSGAIPGATIDAAGGTPIDYLDGNVQADRARIQELVLIGSRAQVAVWIVHADPVNGFDPASLVRGIEELVKQYTVIRVYHNADTSDPWVDDTPLAYFDRPRGEFVAIPPVKWVDRDPKMQIQQRPADKGALLTTVPIVSASFNVTIGLSILLEHLFIADPDACGNFWPGQMCPASAVKNMPGYVGR